MRTDVRGKNELLSFELRNGCGAISKHFIIVKKKKTQEKKNYIFNYILSRFHAKTS